MKRKGTVLLVVCCMVLVASFGAVTGYADDQISLQLLRPTHSAEPRPTQVPEPVTISLLAVGLVSIGLGWKRRGR